MTRSPFAISFGKVLPAPMNSAPHRDRVNDAADFEEVGAGGNGAAAHEEIRLPDKKDPLMTGQAMGISTAAASSSSVMPSLKLLSTASCP